MKKAKEEIPITPKEFDYISLVDDLNEEAFSFCASLLYPLYDYRILKLEEFRKVDLKENLLRMENLIPKDLKKLGGVTYYCMILKLYLEQKFVCKTDSRAERYRQRAISALGLAQEEEGTAADLDDGFFVFMSLLRAVKEAESGEKPIIEKPVLRLHETDYYILSEIYQNHKKMPEGVDGKKGLMNMKTTTEADKKNAGRFMYINSILLFARMLQKYGNF